MSNKITSEEADFISRAKDLVGKYAKDDMCKSCVHWRPANVKLVPSHCMNSFNDRLVTVFNPHGFDYSNLRQVLESKHNSSCQFYKFEKCKYDYLKPEIERIETKYGIDNV